MQRLGDPGIVLADTVEEPVLFIEESPMAGHFEVAPWLGERFVVRVTGNDGLPTAQIDINLGDNDTFASSPPGEALSDWLVRGNYGQALAPQDALLGGRRIRIATARSNPADDWIIFEGYIQRLALGFSGSSKTRSRWLTAFAVDSAIVADCEATQQVWGQWRRTRGSELNRLSGQGVARLCCRIGVPLVFNPRGRPNCHPAPLEFGDGTKVYIPTDVDDPDAIPWTVAKALRYIQWAALQPAPPLAEGSPRDYDVLCTSIDKGIEELKDTWTSLSLQYANLNELLDSDMGGVTLLEHPPDDGSGHIERATLLRAIPDLACEGMSTLEAFAYVCDRAGVLMDIQHAFDLFGPQGDSRTWISFSIRGHHKTKLPQKWKPDVGQQDDPPRDPPGGEPDATGAVTRMIWLYLPSDKTDGAGLTPAELIAKCNITEGEFLLDECGQRAQVRAGGDPARYEMTVELRPGWKPDAWWDINPDDPDAVANALARVGTPEWEQRHVANRASAANVQAFSIGRHWVLNEDGAFKADDYKRVYGHWKTADGWLPFDFEGTGGVTDLTKRGDQGWSARRRKFLPPLALDTLAAGDQAHAREVGFQVAVSFNSGVAGSWRYGLVTVANEPDRCAITITNPDPRQVVDETGKSFVAAYIEGKLRVRVTAVIEGDDQAYGCAKPRPGGPVLPWIESLDRRGQVARDLRTKASNIYRSEYNLLHPADRDDSVEADGLCRRLRDEVEVRRTAGQVTIPYLLQHRAGVPWPTYRLGDEIWGVSTGNAATRLEFLTGQSPDERGPRVVGITYTWSRSPGEQSTTLQLEDETYGPDDLIGMPFDEEDR